MHVDTDLSGQEAETDAFLENAANAQEIDRVNKWIDKISIRDVLTKDKMILSEKSSRTIFEMVIVKLMELKKDTVKLMELKPKTY